MGGSIDRRTVLKRGAATGAALWAAPVIHSIPASATEATSPPPQEQPPGKDISYVAIVVACSGVSYRVKYEAGAGWEDKPGFPKGNGKGPECFPVNWESAVPANGGDLGIQLFVLEPNRWRIVIPSSCGGNDPVEGAVAKAGANDGLQCEPPVFQGWTDAGYELIMQL